MLQFWVQAPRVGWAVTPLEGPALALAPTLAPVEPRPDSAALRDAPAVLVRFERSEAESGCALLVRPTVQVRVNGTLVRSGLRILRDGDSIRADGLGVVYFSTECLARVEPFPGADEPVCCPRCLREIEPPQAAVRCPQCQVWHHQDEAAKRICWTYAERCSLCDQLTDLNAGYRWTPGAL